MMGTLCTPTRRKSVYKRKNFDFPGNASKENLVYSWSLIFLMFTSMNIKEKNICNVLNFVLVLDGLVCSRTN